MAKGIFSQAEEDFKNLPGKLRSGFDKGLRKVRDVTRKMDEAVGFKKPIPEVKAPTSGRGGSTLDRERGGNAASMKDRAKASPAKKDDTPEIVVTAKRDKKPDAPAKKPTPKKDAPMSDADIIAWNEKRQGKKLNITENYKKNSEEARRPVDMKMAKGGMVKGAKVKPAKPAKVTGAKAVPAFMKKGAPKMAKGGAMCGHGKKK